MLEFYRKSKKGCVIGKTPDGLVSLSTDHENGNSGCKAMGNFAYIFDDYMKNTYYYQIKIEENYDIQNT